MRSQQKYVCLHVSVRPLIGMYLKNEIYTDLQTRVSTGIKFGQRFCFFTCGNADCDLYSSTPRQTTGTVELPLVDHTNIHRRTKSCSIPI